VLRSSDTEQPLAGRREASARFALRDATAEAHARLDSLYTRLDLADPADYATFLTSHAAAFIPVEDALADAGAETLVPGWAATRRADALRADLAEMAIEVPPPAPRPSFLNDAQVLGALYVVEGSRLGGAVLIRSVKAGLPTRFLTPGNPALWRAFTAKLDEQLSSAALLDDAAASATAVFGLFERAARAHLDIPL